MILLYYIVFILYEEVLYKVFAATNFYLSIFSAIFYFLFIASLLALITSLLPNKYYKHFLRIITFLLSFWYGACIIVKRTFGITLSLSATSMADQFLAGGFIDTTVKVIGQNWFIVILVLLPFVFSFFLTAYYNKKDLVLKKLYPNVIIILVCFGLFIGSLFVDFEHYGLKDLYFNKRNNNQCVEHFGVLPSLLIDIRKELTGFEEKIIIEEIEEPEVVVEETKVYDKQIESFDFKKLADEETNNNIKQLHEFFNSEAPTDKNEYTGLFEDKNLIYIMAESFDGYAVDQKMTPTLYKMIHNGFYFKNYYSTTNLSTIGGEFQELTGLVPDLTMLSWKWRESEGYGNYYPYALGNVFKGLGYKTYAYHNHDFNFQDRNIYLKTQGFDNYIGCGSGMENKGVACSYYGFPESDDEMILGTYKDYINDDHFMVYYATVSGHMGWEFTDNKMSIKHQEEVKDLNNSETIKAFKAANLELELAMSDLLKVLEENNRLDDTVIVLASDHHPYGLSFEQMQELATKPIDEVFEIYRNNLIIYNPSIEHTEIDKLCSTIDVLPTTLNLFNIKYDSRIIIGKDIMAKGYGLVIFADDSWINDTGRYNANTSSFEKAVSYDIDNSYVEKITNLVANRKWASKNIMYYDYYRKLFNK